MVLMMAAQPSRSFGRAGARPRRAWRIPLPDWLKQLLDLLAMAAAWLSTR